MNTAEKLNLEASLFELIKGLVVINDADKLLLQAVVTGVLMDSRLLE